jgi:HTH-type transcriptional regulator, transcriptional repressor of NAD biosynthesis genes
MGDDELYRAWTGGGGWNDSPPDPVPDPPKRSEDDDRDGDGDGDGANEQRKKKKDDDEPAQAAHGVVAGRFLPPHLGHRYLIDFAQARSKHVTVFVMEDASDSIPGTLRERWLHEAFPNVDVLRVNAREMKRSAEAWGRTIKADLFFASDAHDGMDAEIAQAIGAKIVLVDPERDVVPISGEEIRSDVMGRLDYVLPTARSHFVRRVAILGPESTGKTTLARTLASAYRTVVVPERARFVAEQKGGALDYADMGEIARGQIASSQALLAQANRLLFCDTNLRSIDLWSRRLFDRSPSWIQEEAKRDIYDLVIITAPDVPFVGAAHHDQPGARRAFFDAIVKAETYSPASVVVVQGSWDERERLARNAVDALLTSPTFLPARQSGTNRSRGDTSSPVVV